MTALRPNTYAPNTRAEAALAAKLSQLAEAERLVAATQENLNRLADTETP